MSKVITIAQQKGGSGKTTLAAHLAVCLSQVHKFNVSILDTDPQGSLGRWYMLREEKLQKKNLIQFKTASLWGAQYEAKMLKQNNDFIIIDTPPKIDADGRPAMQIADIVLIPISPSQVDFWATENIVELALREKKQILLIINRANVNSKLIKEARSFAKKLNINQAKTVIGNRQIFVLAMGDGLTSIEKQKTGKGTFEIKELTQEILSNLS